jgi:hypothetical protein
MLRISIETDELMVLINAAEPVQKANNSTVGVITKSPGHHIRLANGAYVAQTRHDRPQPYRQQPFNPNVATSNVVLPFICSDCWVNKIAAQRQNRATNANNEFFQLTLDSGTVPYRTPTAATNG